MEITALYAGLLAPLFILLSVRVIGARRNAKVGVGDGGNVALLRRMRVHANFAEYVPFALLLMALAENLGVWTWLIHVMGITLLAGRLSHAYGVSQQPEVFKFRIFGMAATLTVIAAAAAICFLGALQQFAVP
ncbi:MAG: MAPEG family protein [Aestuariivirga sp.]